MSELSDLKDLALRAYTPGIKSARNGDAAPGLEDKKAQNPAILNRRLAPAFSIELSLAAQQVLGNVPPQAAPEATEARFAPKTEGSASNTPFSDGVGRREAPLANGQRNVALGSRLNIQV